MCNNLHVTPEEDDIDEEEEEEMSENGREVLCLPMLSESDKYYYSKNVN